LNENTHPVLRAIEAVHDAKVIECSTKNFGEPKHRQPVTSGVSDDRMLGGHAARLDLKEADDSHLALPVKTARHLLANLECKISPLENFATAWRDPALTRPLGTAKAEAKTYYEWGLCTERAVDCFGAAAESTQVSRGQKGQKQGRSRER
jgi:hypothetical protein